MPVDVKKRVDIWFDGSSSRNEQFANWTMGGL